MGERGFTKQPAAIAKLKGVYRKDRYKDDIADSNNSLDFVYNNIPMPPEYFDDLAIEMWNKTLLQASKINGYISFIDLSIFEEYCLCYSELKALHNLCMGSKIYYKDDNGVRRLNPIYTERDKKREHFLKLSREFGFTPSSRTRISLQQIDAPKKDEWGDGL